MDVEAASSRLSNRPQRLGLHPVVYRLLIGSVIGLFLSAWIFFGHGAYTGLQLGIVAVFLAMFVGVPWAMSRMGRRRGGQEADVNFGEWSAGEFQTWTGPLPAGHATVMILIAPIAAVAGMFGISAVAYMASIGAL